MTPAVSEVPARILVVDDDEAAAHTLGRLLRQEGYDVRVAVSGQAGLQESESSPPDAIILDLRMPAVDGLEFLRRLRHKENQRGTPVAVVTGDYFLDETMLAELQQLRATLRFKPLWLDDLAGLARDLLRVTS